MALVSTARELFKVMILAMHGIHPADQSSTTIEFPIKIIK